MAKTVVEYGLNIMQCLLKLFSKTSGQTAGGLAHTSQILDERTYENRSEPNFSN